MLIYRAGAGLSCGMRDLQSLMQHAGSLVAALEIWITDQGMNLGSRHQELGVLAPGPPGKSQEYRFRH